MKVNDVLRCGPWTCYCGLLSGPIATKYYLDFRFMRCSNVHFCVLGNYGVFTFSRVRIGSFSTLGGETKAATTRIVQSRGNLQSVSPVRIGNLSPLPPSAGTVRPFLGFRVYNLFQDLVKYPMLRRTSLGLTGGVHHMLDGVYCFST